MKTSTDILNNLQRECVVLPMVNVIQCAICKRTWESDGEETHADGCPSGEALEHLKANGVR